ncbi:MAG: hypothetical protein GWP06_19285 [Actinobacteria bacterium]|nr:hypothetical protein [Actinomycetota bacterium]
MRQFTQTEQEIIEFLEKRTKKLLDGTALPHEVVFINQEEKENLLEALNNLASKYGLIATA